MVAHLKAGTASHGWVSVRVSNGNIAYAMIDFSAGTSTHGSYGSVTNPSSTVTALGSDWYRLTLTATVSSPLLLAFMGISDGTAVQSDGYETGWNSTGQTMYAWGIQLSSTNSKVYDSPTTTQISRSYSPLLKTASADEPRFEYAADGQSVGLKIEAQATNLVTHSADFDDSSWTKVRSEIDSSAAIAPDGSLTADYFRATSDSANGAYATGSAVSTTNNATVNASVYHKKTGGDNYAAILVYDGSGNGARQWWNLSSNTTASSNTSGSGFTVVNAGVEEVGNGWVRLNVSVACTGTAVQFTVYPSVATDGGYGNSVSTTNALIWGAQLTESSAPSSLIQTNGSSVTRAADSCSVDLSQINYSGGEVSLLGEGTSSDQTDYRGLFSLHLDSSNFISLYAHSEYNRRVLIKADGVGSELSGGAGTKAGLSFDTNDVSFCLDGGAVTADTSQTIPNLTGATAYIGSWSATSHHLNGHIKRLSLYSVALSDVELQSLTSS